MMPQGTMPQGGHYMQQGPMFPPRAPLQFNPQMQEQQQLHHQPQVLPFPGHMGMRPGAINGMHAMHADPSHGGSADHRPAPNLSEFPQGSSTPSSSVDGRGSKQDAGGAASEPAAADDQRNSVMGRNRDGEPNLTERA
ncbi:putative GRF1-interacting factor 2 [Cocos nucifera]|nr:putative GRF1-interacting factor 2 [Cocos nucifera]